MARKGSQIVIDILRKHGVRVVSGVPGGPILPLYDALADSGIRHVLARHEQGAAFIAQGMARVSGKAGVCIASSGPGALNLVTAIADAQRDSIPLVVITGQVPRSLLGTDAFQEADVLGVTMSCVKWNTLVLDPADLEPSLEKAFFLAEEGRPGAVLVDIPKDILLMEIEDSRAVPTETKTIRLAANVEPIQQAAARIARAKRPVIYGGGGLIQAACSHALAELVARQDLPVALTLMGLGAFPASAPHFLGMLGMHGTPQANLAIAEADLVIALGVRFDDRATGRLDAFCPQADVIHIDIDASELGRLHRADIAIHADLALALPALVEALGRQARTAWREQIARIRRQNKIRAEGPGLRPSEVISSLRAAFGAETRVSTDVGQHQMWTAQSWSFDAPRRFLTSGGMGTMGFGLPAAIGACLADPATPVVCMSGDGSLLMNVQELATLADLAHTGIENEAGEVFLPRLCICVLDNSGLGLVHQQQSLFYKNKQSADSWPYKTDLAAVAQAFGIPARVATRKSEVASVVEWAARQEGPCLISVAISSEAMVWPMVAPGAANAEMLGLKETTRKSVETAI